MMILGIFDGLGFKSALLMALCVALLMALLALSDGFFFFFFNMCFCFAGILVSSG